MQLLLGDCLDKLKELPENSVDSLVTDPPYGLSEAPNIADVMRAWLDGNAYTHKSKGFMGKQWDAFVPGPEYWREVYRVLKPGAHGLVFAGTRTVDVMGIALRFAGFEIRDTVLWLHGQGFPKSMDISKAIDKAAGAEREVVGQKDYSAPDIRGNSYDQSHVSERERLGVAITAPATDAAKQWQGYGTALKPAVEPIILVRKTISEKTVAANVLRWGVGGLNIDGCRIEGAPVPCQVSSTGSGFNKYAASAYPGKRVYQNNGRFPANLIFSHTLFCTEEKCDDSCAVKMLDEQSGTSKAGQPRTRHKPSPSSHFGSGSDESVVGQKEGFGDSGGASRFFYCAKVSSSERNAGLEGMPDRLVKGYEGGSIVSKDHPQSSPSKEHVAKNNHPTVKPQKLMRYLCRLITPPGGTVLDCFLGSGSTGVAALAEGFKFIGIERESEYMQIAQKRIEHASTQLADIA